MRKLLGLILYVFILTGCTAIDKGSLINTNNWQDDYTEPSLSNAEKWQDDYSEFLRNDDNYVKNMDSYLYKKEPCFFALYDFERDGIPELFIDNPVGIWYRCTASQSIVEVFANVETMRYLIPHNNELLGLYSLSWGVHSEWYYYHDIQDGTFFETELAYSRYTPPSVLWEDYTQPMPEDLSSIYEYVINGNEVTFEEYEKLTKGIYESTDLPLYEINEENIKKYIYNVD